MEGEGLPDPLIKDLFQLQCLYMFGGWWADMDYFMLRSEPPDTEGNTWLLGTDYERKTSTYKKAQKATILVGTDLVSVNLGIMWAKRNTPMLLEAQSKARALWKDKHPQRSGSRAQEGYQHHQLLIHNLFARTRKATLLHPRLTSPFPRWSNWETQLEGRELFVVVLPSGEAILT